MECDRRLKQLTNSLRYFVDLIGTDKVSRALYTHQSVKKFFT